MPALKKIVLVDDDVTNLAVGRNILAEKYDIVTIPSGEKLFKLLERTKPHLILLDIEMPGMNGFDVLVKLKSTKELTDIPVIFLTAKNDNTSELEGLSLGAVDYIFKPFSPPLLLKRIELHLLVESQKIELQDYASNLQKKVLERTQIILSLQNSILKTVANMVEYRDKATGKHVERTRTYLSILLNAGIEQKIYYEEIADWNMELCLQSSQLHDMGKIFIRDNILFKPGKLTPEEFEIMKQHTIFGENVITEIQKETPDNDFLTYAKIFAGSHHEKWDGSGYPRGLKGEEIPLQGRFMAIVDVYDALVSIRPYKGPLSHKEAVNIIINQRGSHFDPYITDLFESVQEKFEGLRRGK